MRNFQSIQKKNIFFSKNFLFKKYNLSFSSIENQINLQNIRSFCIIAHIDHGKSTLADRFLELTKTIEFGHKLYLDKLKVERERGITVKAQTVTMFYNCKGQKYLLNLIDTPGHVDFTYEVSRSMLACQGAVLLVDAAQGIQAQTISNFELAKKNNLKLIPVINKIDIETANPKLVAKEMVASFDIKENEIIYISAKNSINVENVLEKIIDIIPAPQIEETGKFKGYLFDSWFIKDKGVVMIFEIKEGSIKKGDFIFSCAFKKRYDVGILNPEMKPEKILYAGQVGYILTNMKSAGEASIGDTFHKENEKVLALPGFQKIKPMVFAGIFPDNPKDYIQLEKAIRKLILNDPSVTLSKQRNGLRCGFLGLLHMEVFKQRLDDEFNIESMLTTPTVPFRCILKNKKMIEIENAMDAPEPFNILHFEEPFAETTLIVPKFSINSINHLCQEKRGIQKYMNLIDENKCYLKYEMPYSEIITDFFDRIKSLTRGYGSVDFEQTGFKKSDIRKLIIMLMGEPVDALSFMVHVDRAEIISRKICKKLKEELPAQLFTIIIQAKFGSKIIAREEVKAMGKNVTAKCYGGDYSRKRKLLERQKEGKKFLKSIGKVQIDKNTFKNLLKLD